MNLLAAVWLASALVPQPNIGGYVLSIPDALARMHQGYRILFLGDLLLAAGSVAGLLASHSTRVDRPARDRKRGDQHPISLTLRRTRMMGL